MSMSSYKRCCRDNINTNSSRVSFHLFFTLLLGLIIWLGLGTLPSAHAGHNSGSSSGSSTSASLSTDTVNIDAGENGSWTISGNDGGNQREFRWTLPSGLNVTKGSSSNLNKFDIKWDKGYVKVESDGKGSFSATIRISSNSFGTYVMQNTRAEISMNPRNVTVVVADGGGGTTPTDPPPTEPPPTEPPPTEPPPDGGGTASGNADYTFYIETGTVNVTASPESGNGAINISVWGYTDSEGANSTFPGPSIEVVEGSSFTVEVVNNLNQNHNFVIQGVTNDTTAIPPGGSRTYTINAPSSGVYRYGDTLANGVNRAAGLFGAMVVRPSAGSTRAWSNAPSANQQRLWVMNDMDKPRWLDRTLAGNSVSTGSYRPNYFFMNGMNGFQAMGDADTVVEGNVGELFLVRIVNAGQFDQSLHWHGNHFRVISRNGNRLGSFEWQDTINVKAGSTAMVLYRIEQPGHFPMHVHTAQMETGNGVYLNGTAAMIIGH